jgi:hypothetical protein
MLALAALFGAQYGAMLLPIYRSIIGWSCTGYRIAGFDLLDHLPEARFALVVIGAASQPVSAGAPAQAAVATVSTLLGHSLQHPIVMFSLLLTWPGFTALRRVGLLFSALPVLLLVECLDVPLVLSGNVISAFAERGAPANPLVVQWIDFLDGGGRIVLSLLGAATTLLVFRFCGALRRRRSLLTSP